jgi:hypothetical protein
MRHYVSGKGGNRGLLVTVAEPNDGVVPVNAVCKAHI